MNINQESKLYAVLAAGQLQNPPAILSDRKITPLRQEKLRRVAVRMKKRILLLALVITACSFAGIGSLAYFTANERTENVITAGNVDIELCKETPDGKPFPDERLTGIMPGQVIDKIVYVKNTGQNTAWIRVKPVKICTLADGTSADPEEVETKIRLNLNEEDWTERDGWYYYNEPVEAGGQTARLFTAITFDSSLDNRYKKSSVRVNVDAQAVQVDNNGTAVLDAAGWPAE